MSFSQLMIWPTKFEVYPCMLYDDEYGIKERFKLIFCQSCTHVNDALNDIYNSLQNERTILTWWLLKFWAILEIATYNSKFHYFTKFEPLFRLHLFFFHAMYFLDMIYIWLFKLGKVTSYVQIENLFYSREIDCLLFPFTHVLDDIFMDNNVCLTCLFFA